MTTARAKGRIALAKRIVEIMREVGLAENVDIAVEANHYDMVIKTPMDIISVRVYWKSFFTVWYETNRPHLRRRMQLNLRSVEEVELVLRGIKLENDDADRSTSMNTTQHDNKTLGVEMTLQGKPHG